jgi:hypothetical protein
VADVVKATVVVVTSLEVDVVATMRVVVGIGAVVVGVNIRVVEVVTLAVVVAAGAGSTQRPRTHLFLPLHLTPQPPQFLLSNFRYAQYPPQVFGHRLAPG